MKCSCGLVLFALLCYTGSCLASVNLPGTLFGGIVNPEAHFQRFRRELYPQSRPFFQWWYFWVRDESTATHHAFYVHSSFCEANLPCNQSGVFVMAAQVDALQGATWSRYERYNLSSLVAATKGQHIMVGDTFGLDASDDGNVIHLTGTLSNHAATYRNVGIDQDTPISWNITLFRQFGWYAQPYEELPDRLTGVIQWNTYAHSSRVEGSILVGDRTYAFSKESADHRAYADMNWGWDFPEAPGSSQHAASASVQPHQSHLDFNYSWGWFYAGRPASSSVPEISVIAGCGFSYVDSIMKTMDGRFADIRIGNLHFGLSVIGMFLPADPHYVETSNDGKVIQFEVTKSSWATFSDDLGDASMPLFQGVVLETASVLLHMNFTANLSSTNRLLFPFNTYIFSDFETLGAYASVKIWNKTDTRQEPISFESFSGGLEYGYRLPTSPAGNGAHL